MNTSDTTWISCLRTVYVKKNSYPLFLPEKKLHILAFMIITFMDRGLKSAITAAALSKKA